MQRKSLARELTPPVLWRVAKQVSQSISGNRGGRWVYGAEQPAAFYDESFRAAKHWRQHYTVSHYYPLWAIIADRVKRAGVQSILDIGCGPGQVASLMHDKGIPNYVGLDFSEARIEQAQRVCPGYTFQAVDVFQTDVLEQYPYDCSLIMEFLEHVEQDMGVVKRLNRGTWVLATVPNFPAAGHVRYFSTADEVYARYASCFDSIQVEEHLETTEKKYFLIEAII